MLSLLLVACGGGGGGSGTGSTGGTGGSAIFDTSTLQGRWTTGSGAVVAYTAVVVPAADNTATAWLLAQDGSRLFKLGATGSQTLAGKNFSLGEASSADANGNFSAALDVSPRSVTLSNILAAPLVLAQSDTMTGMAAQADAAGNWKATAGAMASSWTLNDTGIISGSSTTGCTYGGNTTTPTTVKLYTVEFSETCAGTSTSFSGIATLSADKSLLTVAAATTDNSRGVALLFSRQ